MILLDTHVVLWLAYEPDRISRDASSAIGNAQAQGEELAISCASLYEIAWLIERKRLKMPVDGPAFFRQLDRLFAMYPVDSAVALGAARIPAPFHGDPMDGSLPRPRSSTV